MRGFLLEFFKDKFVEVYKPEFPMLERGQTIRDNKTDVLYKVCFVLPFIDELKENDAFKPYIFCGNCVINAKLDNKTKIYTVSAIEFFEALVKYGTKADLRLFKKYVGLLPEGHTLKDQVEAKFNAVSTVDPALVKKIKESELANFSRDKYTKEFIHLLLMMGYQPEDNDFCWDVFNKDFTEADFPSGAVHVAHNRAFYIDDNSNIIVVSKNLYDTFWASTGNGFQSCFSLSSPYKCICGVPYWMAHKGYYMVYRTSNAEVKKCVAWNGKKAHIPSMFWRAWGYDVNGTFYVGTRYGNMDEDACSGLFINIDEVSDHIKIPDFDKKAFKYKTYLDNITSAGRLCRKSNGNAGYMGTEAYFGYSNYGYFQNNLTFNNDIVYNNCYIEHGNKMVTCSCLDNEMSDTPFNRKLTKLIKEMTGLNKFYVIDPILKPVNMKNRGANGFSHSECLSVSVVFNSNGCGLVIRDLEGKRYERSIDLV